MQGVNKVMPTVKELRTAMGLTQTDLAVRAGVGIVAVGRLERGEPVLRSTLNLVAHALFVKPEEITGVKVVNRVLKRGREVQN